MSRYFFALLFAAIITTTVYAQTDDPTPTPTPAPVAPANRPRVFITDSQSWETSGAAGGINGAFGASSSGGARPQTAEIIKTFGERFPNVTVNNIQSKANYVVVLDHEHAADLDEAQDDQEEDAADNSELQRRSAVPRHFAALSGRHR